MNISKGFNVKNTPWECPRCNRMNAPFSPSCFCIATKEDKSCEECIVAAMKVFKAGYPGKELINMWTKYFHENCDHTGVK